MPMESKGLETIEDLNMKLNVLKFGLVSPSTSRVYKISDYHFSMMLPKIEAKISIDAILSCMY